MHIDNINRLLEKLEKTDFLKIEKEHIEKMQKEMKKERNKRYYENYKSRIREKNNIAGQERYENDEEFRQKRKQYNRERYLRQKIKAEMDKAMYEAQGNEPPVPGYASARFLCKTSRPSIEEAEYKILIDTFLAQDNEDDIL